MMNRLFAPAMWLVNRLTYPFKFLLVSALFLVVMGIAMVGFHGYVKMNVDFSAKEGYGTEYLSPVISWMHGVVQHEMAVESYLKGNPAAKDEALAIEAKLDETAKAIDALNAKHEADLQGTKDWQAVKESWTTLKGQAFSGMGWQASNAAHDAILTQSIALINKVGATSNLILDPDVDSYFVMDTMLFRLVPMIQYMDQYRALATRVAAAKSISLEDQIQLVTLETRINDTLALTKVNLETSIQATGDKQLKTDLEAVFGSYFDSVEKFTKSVHNNLIAKYDNQAGIAVQPAQVQGWGWQAIDQSYQYYQTNSKTLERLLEARIEKIQAPFNWNVIQICVLLALAAYILAGFYKTVVQAVSRLEDASNRLADGDLTVHVELNTQDELKRVEYSFNKMAEAFNALISQIKYSTANVASASEELSATSSQMKGEAQSMSQLSGSTMTVTEEVDANIKTVAAAIEQSTNSIKTVCEASEKVEDNIQAVGEAAETVSGSMKTVADSAEEMSTSVTTVATAIEEMSSSLTEVSKNATQAAHVAGVAEQTAQSTRATVDALGNSAREIEDVLEVIKEIASQTNLLALNATIEAASAGEAGKGFAVVANEVKELAKRSADATEDIRSRIESMQSNTSAAVNAISEISDIIGEINMINSTIASAVEEQTATVNEISRNITSAASSATEVSKNVQTTAETASLVARQVQEASLSMRQITENIEELAKGANEIAKGADEAASGATQMARSVEQVSRSSRETEHGAAGVEQTATELSNLASQLEKMVEQFRIAG